ncbi:ribonuclease III [Hazenella sp. IB182357]|uniref:Mini-ribonuclease 3 n=1 Tax=Polycladospora coralii TaxID=2771432 RepID=A0A926NAC4_9BACL|nr:ribonuclease III domain-containing protein [Polycladospora coralii]MBD1372387.1 ribonuclease III [Polycladospora coralii]MBS7531423.1 ribonuclease III [Polycladospora coralii]
MKAMKLGELNMPIKQSPKEIAPQLLAYVGDAVYEIYVRYHLLARGVLKPSRLQKEAVRYVSASAQAFAIRALENSLTEEEQWIFKRGRNAKTGSVPRNARVVDYRYSTGMEALIGFLYLSGAEERLDVVIKKILDKIEEGD